MSCPNAIEIVDANGKKYAIAGPFLEEYDTYENKEQPRADRVVLLYQIGRALAARKKTIKIDALYTQCAVFSASLAGNNVNIEVFRVVKTLDNRLWIGCRLFEGDNARHLIEAARKVWKEIGR